MSFQITQLQTVRGAIPLASPDGIDVPNPFAPIEIQPLTSAGSEVPGKAIHLRVDTEKGPKLVFVASHSPRYKPISNRAAVNIAEEVMIKSGHSFTPFNSVWDGKKFAILYKSDDHTISLPGNDQVTLGLYVQNSYDASLLFGVRLMVIRYACMNGLFFGNELAGFAFKHVNGSSDEAIEDAIAQLNGSASAYQGVVSRFPEMMNAPTNLETFTKWARELSEGGAPKWPKGKLLDVIQQIDTHGGANTVWTMLNDFTYVATHDLHPFAATDLSARVGALAMNEIDVDYTVQEAPDAPIDE